MMFRSFSLALLRLRLEKSGFYENITFENKMLRENVKKITGRWMFNLQSQKGIKIKKFQELFGNLDEIAFPIKIKNCFSVLSNRHLDIVIVDNNGKEYYMLVEDIGVFSNKFEDYFIGRKNSQLEPLIERNFYYQISENGAITLTGTRVRKLTSETTYSDTIVEFGYDYFKNITEVTLNSYPKYQIKIQYPTIGYEFDKKVLDFLLKVDDKNWYYYDVYPILKWILPYVLSEKVSLSIIARVENEIYSQLNIVNGDVKVYTRAEVISEEEIKIISRKFDKKLEEFLAQ